MNLLAIFLFLPWFAIIGFTYWHLPRNLSRTRMRSVFDSIALLIAIVLASVAAAIAMGTDWQDAGKIWPQVAAVLFAYGAFLLLMLLAAIVRQRVWRL